MMKEVFLTILFANLAFSEDGFQYRGSDGKDVTYKISGQAMTWINSAKVNPLKEL
jgi:hypothetical protein